MMLTYLIATFSIFLVNVIPVFAPPTWIVLSLFKISNPELNILILTFIGVIGTVAGRFAMYLYSKALGRYVPQRYMGNINYFKKATDERRRGVLLGSFVYSLSPLPSNFLFIGSGISGMKIIHMLTGFTFGRTISYWFLIHGFYQTCSFLGVFGTGNIQLFGGLLGIFVAVSMIFIDFKKIVKKAAKIVSLIRGKWGLVISPIWLLNTKSIWCKEKKYVSSINPV